MMNTIANDSIDAWFEKHQPFFSDFFNSFDASPFNERLARSLRTSEDATTARLALGDIVTGWIAGSSSGDMPANPGLIALLTDAHAYDVLPVPAVEGRWLLDKAVSECEVECVCHLEEQTIDGFRQIDVSMFRGGQVLAVRRFRMEDGQVAELDAGAYAAAMRLSENGGGLCRTLQ